MKKRGVLIAVLSITGWASALNFPGLEKAIVKDQVKVVQKLVGADINAVSALGETPLMLSVRFHAKKSFTWILTQKPNLNLKNKSGETALTQILSDDSDSAISFWVQELVKAGADLHLKGGADLNPIELAVQKNDSHVVKALAAAGKSWLDEVDAEGKTPLIRAALSGLTESVEALGELGASAKIKDKSGLSALDYAKKQNFTKTIKILNSILAKHTNSDQK